MHSIATGNGILADTESSYFGNVNDQVSPSGHCRLHACKRRWEGRLLSCDNLVHFFPLPTHRSHTSVRQSPLFQNLLMVTMQWGSAKVRTSSACFPVSPRAIFNVRDVDCNHCVISMMLFLHLHICRCLNCNTIL